MSNETNWYGNVFKSWQAKVLGPKPTADMLAKVHNLGCRPGKQALAIAMGLRDCGVTGSQIVIACGAPQLNKMRGFITDAMLKREPVAPSAEGHTVYKLAVTKKGDSRIERTAKAAADKTAAGNDGAKPAKPAKNKKAVHANGKPRNTKKRGVQAVIDGGAAGTTATVEPASDAANVTEQAPAADQPQA